MPTDIPRPKTERENKIAALATQLAYASASEMAPPDRWSPLRAMAYWDQLTGAKQAAWIDYAGKVAMFAGVSLS